MSRVTVGKKWPRSRPRGDTQALCDYCGVQWFRSQLSRDGVGLLVCPDEGGGRSTSELSQLNAAAAGDLAARRLQPMTSRIDTDDGSVTPVHRTTIEDVEI